MGYDITSFREKPNDEFICAICLGVYKNPVTDECGHVYCCDCLHEWSGVKETCPISCKKLRKGYIRKAPLPLINLVNSLQIKCQKCEAKYVRLDQLEEGCPDCRVSRMSGPAPSTSNRRRSSFGQSTRFERTENFWEGEWVKWAGVAGAVGAGLLVLMSSMKNKNRD